jgi:hypothetical protein
MLRAIAILAVVGVAVLVVIAVLGESFGRIE